MTDINKLKELAVRALPFAPGEWFVENGIDQVRDCANDFVCETGEDDPIKASFIAAANPQAILKLIAEVDLLSARLKAENCAHKDTQKHCEWLAQDLKECASALPGTYYMDPPDGGNVSIPEQIRRMAKDAARYRWLRDLPEDSPHEQIGNFPGWMWDEAIDKGMAEIQVTQPGATSSP